MQRVYLLLEICVNMKVEVVSIGTELLISDILDTNAAFISRSLREVQAKLTCKITVGDDQKMIANVVRVGLGRADIVLTTGGLGSGTDDLTRQAICLLTGRALSDDFPGISGAKRLGDANGQRQGLMIEESNGVIICLPGNRREMAYLLETEVLPYFRQQISVETKTGWILLRTVGLMESSLKQSMAPFLDGTNHKITFDSFAGQTNIRVWAEANSDADLQKELERYKSIIMERLGDHVFGFEQDRLEQVVLEGLIKSSKKLALAECQTGRVLGKSLARIEDAHDLLTLIPVAGWQELAEYLQLEELSLDNLTQWCRIAAERLLVDTQSDLGLVLFNNVTQGGVQVLVTLASSMGVSVTQRSFGGHPDNIGQWAFTLGLSHLRRWLMVHQ